MLQRITESGALVIGAAILLIAFVAILFVFEKKESGPSDPQVGGRSIKKKSVRRPRIVFSCGVKTDRAA